MRYAVLILGLLLSSFPLTLLAQATTNDFISLKSFTQPSPEAAALGRYGSMPVGLSSGIPEISVPLAEIRSRKLSLPLSLSYHAAGVRVEDVATTAGLGWVLNAGGAISRTIVGQPDEGRLNDNNSPVLKSRAQLEGVLYNANDLFNIRNLANGGDSQSDVYNINIPGVAGRFVYDVDKQLHYTPVDKQLKIVRNAADTTYTITDDAGAKYFFGEKEYTYTTSSHINAITSWYLTRMISADLTDTITFTYKPASAFEEENYSYSVFIDLPLNPERSVCCERGQNVVNWLDPMSQTFYYRKLIDSIKFANGFVKFEYANDRQDPGNERLTKIKIGNNLGVLKEIELVHSYFQSEAGSKVAVKYTKRLKLDKVKFNDKSASEVNSYSFGYNTTPLPAYYKEIVSHGVFIMKSVAMDYWGYYNGEQTLGTFPYRTLLPKAYTNDIIQFLGIYGGGAQVANSYEQRASDRSANPIYTKACILDKITYPTGGYTIFEYENNTLSEYQDSKDLSGGLRIGRMHDFDPLGGVVSSKTYVYNRGLPISWVRKDDFKYTTSTIQYADCLGALYCTTPSFYINANPINALNYYGGSPVFYPKVTEYEGFPGDNKGKTEYEFEFEADSVYEKGILVKHWNFSTDKSWARGQLANKKIYKSEGGNYTLVKEIKNHFASLKRKSVRVGQICEQIVFTKGFHLEDYLMSPNTNGWQKVMLNYFDYEDIVLSLGGKMIAKTEEIDYLNNTIVNRQEYAYDNPTHIYPTKITTASSKTNEVISEVRKYPQDKANIQQLTSSASAALEGMIASNILAEPVETDYFRNNSLFRRNRTDYINWNNTNRFYIDLLYQQNGAGPLEPRVKYKSYDERGNPLTLQYVNGHPVSYIWDYNKALATASVTNANDNEIAYTSFESGNNGNWTINSNARVTTNSYTGVNAYNPVNGTITKGGITTDKDYIVSYWSQGGSASVNGSSGESKGAKNGWTLYEHLLQRPGSITITGNVVIDELRLYPKDAQMTSHTHIPLVGIATASVPNGSISYYDYDNYSRLTAIRDNEKKIIKQLDYKYTYPDAMSRWLSTGQRRVIATGLVELEFKDMDPSSSTYNQTRWTPVGIGNYRLLSDLEGWVRTGELRCSSANNGEVEERLEARNPYSPAYGKSKWNYYGISEAMCPIPEGACTAIGRKFINGRCEQGTIVYTSIQQVNLPENGGLRCHRIYHYRWSDGSISQNYDLYEFGECPQDS